MRTALVRAGLDGIWRLRTADLQAGRHIARARVVSADGSLASVASGTIAVLAVGLLEIDGPLAREGSDATLSGRGLPGAELRAVVDGGAPVVAMVAGDGAWTIDLEGLTLGSHSIVLRQRVGAVLGPPLLVSLALVPPAPLTIDGGPGLAVRGYLPALTGTASPGAAIRLTIDGGDERETLADGSGAWSIDVADLDVTGTYALSVTQEVPAGVSPPVTASLAITAYAAATVALLARFAALSTSPSKARADWYDEHLITPLVAAGILAVCDLLYLPAFLHGAVAARVNIAHPGTNDLTPVNSPPAFVAPATSPSAPAEGHLRGDGVSAYYNSAFDPGSVGAQMQHLSCHMMLWVPPGTASNSSTPCGQRTRMISPRTTGGNLATRSGSASTDSAAVGGIARFTAWSRSDNDGYRRYREGALFDAPVRTGSSGNNRTIWLGGLNDTTPQYSPMPIGGYSAGGAIDDAGMAAYRAILVAAAAEAPPP